MLLSIKTKLKLNKSQEILMAKQAGIARFTYNWGLSTWQDLYEDGLKPNKYVLKKFFNNHVKPELAWIKEKGICQKITQYAFDNLGESFQRFFKGLAEYPKFKKKGKHDSFTIDSSGKPIPVGGKSIKLPTIGWVRTYEGLPHTTCKSITISRTADSWFIAFAYEQEYQPTIKIHDVVGVDLGIKELATLSTGVTFSNPKHYKQGLSKLKRLSRIYSRKVNGSKNKRKAKIKLARHHAKIANLRKDTLHKITTYLCKKHAKIVVEDLNVSGMLSNHKLAQAIADCGFYEFKRQLEYKAKKFGCEIIIADRWYPSSKTCSHCGHKKGVLSLSERTFYCENCGFEMDRDLNAAINLSRQALA
ncbi:MAG: IS200/IS605 family element transposase accessory protein TnpB [Dolichospermum sp. LBC05a]|nr:transposase [Dolichospermum sp. OL01]MCO5796466.1 IS200/IS605 family element transposase accessory protein TnpB [Dolichospermum sp. OL03]MCS6280453.1 IS200/IS605 family element transposase accessory protein TnpB [Dolichospermum sp.]QSV58070.1 MAG: IS200/IS605 family element transposase accessory protein TnpB [Dolichospermum sp. LBC05a]